MSPRPARLLGYLGAIGSVALAVVTTYAIRDRIEPSSSLLFFPAVVVSAMYGGYGPALVATLVSTAALAYFFVPPLNSFSVGVDDVVRLSMFALTALATAWLSAARKRAEDAARKSVGGLHAAVSTLRNVSGWPVMSGVDLATDVRIMLTHAANVVTAAHVVVAWESDDEPWLYLASNEVGADAVTRHSLSDLSPLVVEPLADATILCVRRPGTERLVISRGGVVGESSGPALHPKLEARCASRPFVSTPFRTEHLAGRAFFMGIEQSTLEIIPIAEVVSREIGNSLDQMRFAERARELAVREERIRVSRDLHDGVLQALTGIRLELQAVADVGALSTGDHDRLMAVERSLALEQRELRSFIDDLKPSTGSVVALGATIQALREMCSRLTTEWKVPILVHINPPDLSLPISREQSLRLMLHEAVVNALKHAHPSRVVVSIDASETELSVVVIDDGRGFPFRGRLEHDVLVARAAGPVSLRDRVVALDGRLAIESSSTGSRVEFAIPVTARDGESTSHGASSDRL